MSNPYVSRFLYGAAIIASYALTAFAIQLGAGRVPISDDWQWVVPILSAVVTGLLTLLPRVGSEHIAMQTDALKARGVPRHEMVVLSEAEAVQCLGAPVAPATRPVRQVVPDGSPSSAEPAVSPAPPAPPIRPDAP